MSLTNPNKPVTETRLAEFYQQILPYLGGMPEALANKFSKSDLYSTDEKIVGCWTDGKPVYQKSYYFSSLGNGTTSAVASTRVPVNIPNLDVVTKIEGVAYDKANNMHFIPVPVTSGTNSNEWDVSCWTLKESGTQNLVISVARDMRSYSAYMTLQYTKTTDATNSFKYGSETDYSTSEKIIGTWINGKPIYQKTVNTGALPNKTIKTVAHNISNISLVINLYGTMYKNTSGSYTGSTAFMSPMPFVDGSTNTPNATIAITANKTNIIIRGETQDWSSIWVNSYVTIQYTKTTD